MLHMLQNTNITNVLKQLSSCFILFFLQGLDVDAENCAVCIENYKPKDTVRILPCR